MFRYDIYICDDMECEDDFISLVVFIMVGLYIWCVFNVGGWCDMSFSFVIVVVDIRNFFVRDIILCCKLFLENVMWLFR